MTASPTAALTATRARACPFDQVRALAARPRPCPRSGAFGSTCLFGHVDTARPCPFGHLRGSVLAEVAP
jgi:hypothetical protein